ncbi:MAG TPA: DUF5078 domain-containing protein [Mycobacterium sp.]|nr:DUF5078 domain-containing protein [Mycobacterium sp.]
MNGPRQHSLSAVLRGGVAIIALGISGAAFADSAAADATDDYPIPRQTIITTCTAEQILAAARDFTPIYYQRYMIDKHNKAPEVQQAATDSAHYFYSLSSAAYSEQMATNFADHMTLAWPNWAKIFFNNNGVNAWLGKIVCDRLHRGVDANAVESTHFVAINLTRGATQVQTWQFFATAISYCCPDQTPVLENVAAQGR